MSGIESLALWLGFSVETTQLYSLDRP